MGGRAESDAPRPDDVSGALKPAAEQICAHENGVALRLANVYGVGAPIDMGLHGAVERFARAAASGQELTVMGTGTQRIDYVHVADVVRAFDAVLRAPKPPACINIGGGSPTSVVDVARMCLAAGRELGPTGTIVYQPAPAEKVWPDRSLAIDLAADTLGWRPQVIMNEGLRELVQMMHRSLAPS